MDASAHFRGKKITVMGLGLLGRGIGDARYLAECGAELVVTDLKTREQLAESVARLGAFPNITFVLGEHRLQDFNNRDLILKAAGVPFDSMYIAEAKENNIPVRMSADLFAELSGATCVGVTGTRGKSTVAHMVYEILKSWLGLNHSEGMIGRTTPYKGVVLGGNVRDVSTLALLPEATPEHIAVLELDSWQLQGFGEAKMSPHIAVFTTLFPDHLNYYHNNLDAYLADKANIFLYQKPGDTLVLGDQAAPLVSEKYESSLRSHVVVAGAADLPADWRLKVPGAHNRYNAALALAAVRALGIDDSTSRRAFESFLGVPGRLELITEKNGIRVYNDTTATTPEATLAALEALEAPVILIMGGADKGLDIQELLAAVPAYTKRVVLLAGSGTDRARDSFPDAPVYGALAEAVADAFAHAEKGDVILFSPAFASFGMFKNEFDRGDQFNALVKALPQ